MKSLSPYLIVFLSSFAYANNVGHEGLSPPPRANRPEDFLRTENFEKIPDSRHETPNAPQYQTEEGVSALMLSLWSLSSGKVPPAPLLAKAGLDANAAASFLKKLPASAKLTAADRELLRSSFTPDSFNQRNAIRNKYMAFVSRFQDKFPAAANVIPEILTVWGEARNIRGFGEADSLNQQAKMATIIHVIRNRAERRNELKPNILGYKNKWNVVTRRYQFSAFEPYDPNLAEIAFGPRSTSLPYSELNALPRNDQIALQNLSKVIASMNRGEILLETPLVYKNTYHYLTPTLTTYTKENKASLKASIIRSGRRFAMVQIPSKNPEYLSAVPRWSKQSALISHPQVKIKDASNQTFQTQVVSPSDFIYFRGIK